MNRKQIQEARAAAKFAKVETLTKGAVRYKVTLPGHDSKRYVVLIRFPGGTGTCTAECLVDTSRGLIPCPSRSARRNGPCYHVLAAIIAATEANGRKVIFTATKQNADRLARLHSEKVHAIFPITRREGGRQVWGIVIN